MKKLTGDDTPPVEKFTVNEPVVLESKPLETKPNVEVPKKKSNTGTIILIVVIVIAIIGLGMLYNHYKNRNGNSTEPRA